MLADSTGLTDNYDCLETIFEAIHDGYAPRGDLRRLPVTLYRLGARRQLTLRKMRK